MVYKLSRDKVISTFLLTFCWLVFFTRTSILLLKGAFCGTLNGRYVDTEHQGVTLCLAILFFCAMCLPLIVCVIQYFYYSIGVEFSIDKNTGDLLLTTSGKTVTIRFDQLAKVELVSSIAIFEKRNFKFSPVDRFFYVRITTTTGEAFIITCLIAGDELLDFYKDKIEAVPRFIPFVS